MAYTVKKLSEISGVSIRALHYYEKIGILKPAYYGSNGYRYYQKSELLQLQQILFFKELGFTLKQIHKVLGKSAFEQTAALYSHRKTLKSEWEKIGLLLKTIDKTIKHLKGEQKMKDKEFFEGFSLVKKGRGDEPYFAAEEAMLQSLKVKTSDIIEEKERKQIAKEANLIYGQITDCLEKSMTSSSKEVQGLIKKHCTQAERFHEMSRKVYKAMAKLYTEHPEYRKQLDSVHPKLAVFMAKAMKFFANKNLY